MKKTKTFNPNRPKAGREFNGRAHIDELYKTSQWINYSKRYLKINPRCYACGKPSEVVDHIKVHKGDKLLFEKADNMIPLCHKCHNTATALFDRHPIQKLFDKYNWLSRSRKNNMIDFKVMVVPYP